MSKNEVSLAGPTAEKPTRDEVLRENLPLVIFCSLAIAVLAGAVFLTPRLVTALSSAFRLTTAQVGSVFSVYFAGYIISVLAGGVGSDLLGRRRLLLAGSGIMGGSLILFSIAPGFHWILLASFLLGIAGGLVEGPASTLISDLSASNRGLALNLSQVSFSAGAVITPLFAGYCLSFKAGWRIAYATLGVAALLVGGATSKLAFPSSQEENAVRLRDILNLLPDATFLILGASMAIYVGSEQGVASWVSYIMTSELASPELLGSMALSLFWGAMVPGRLLCGWLTTRFDPRLLVLASFTGSLLCMSGIYLSREPWQMLLLTGCTGLLMSGAWPTILAVAGDRFSRYTGTVFGALIACGGIGGLIFPGLIGIAAPLRGVRTSLAIIGVGLSAAGAGLFYALLKREGPRRGAPFASTVYTIKGGSSQKLPQKV